MLSSLADVQSLLTVLGGVLGGVAMLIIVVAATVFVYCCVFRKRSRKVEVVQDRYVVTVGFEYCEYPMCIFPRRRRNDYQMQDDPST